MFYWYSKVTIILRKKNGKETIIVKRKEYQRISLLVNLERLNFENTLECVLEIIDTIYSDL